MKKERQRKSLLMWAGVVLLVGLLVLCSTIFYRSMKLQLFEERREHLSELSIKISEILNTEMNTMQQKADAAKNLVDIGSKTSFATTAEWLEAVRSALEIDNGVLLAVNSKTVYYTSSGYSARWSTPEDLEEEDGIPLIRELTFHSSKDTYLIFKRALDSASAYDEEGNALTHIIVAIPLSGLEDEFTITGFGENIFTYMVNSSGRRLYKQTYNNAFIEEFNVLTALESYDFTEDGAVEKLDDAIRGRASETTEFRVSGTNTRYFMSVVPIEDTDWSVLVFVPTAVLGENSNRIMTYLCVCFAVTVLIVAGLLALLLTLNFYRVRAKENILQQEETNRMLEAAAQEADRMNMVKVQFIGQLASDIRAPINRIVGLVSAARKDFADASRLEDCMNKISRASDHLLTVVNAVLEMSRIESGRVEIGHRPVNIQTIVDNCCSILESQLKVRDIRFEKEMDKVTHTMLIGDEVRLRQVFVNILGNAAKFTPEGGSIMFRMKELEATDSSVSLHFEVEDTGIGMSEDFVEHLFEPFSQEFADSGADYPGVGLGMAITKKYVELMGGSISATSHPNRGTCITIELAMEVFDSDDLLAEPHEQSLRDMRLLLVEDNEVDQKIIQKILGDAGVNVVTVENGQKAIDTFEDSAWDSFDAILMDVMLPDKNGYEVTQTIRTGSHLKGPMIPIIAVTCNTYVEDIAAALSSGMNAHVPKPVDAQYLYGVLGQYYHAE